MSDNGREREMFSTTCTSCNKACEVPFKPTGSKPVLCSECFEKKNPRRDGGRDRRDNGRDRRGGDRRGGDRDRGRRDGGAGAMNNRSEHYDMEFEKLHKKLDKILALLTPKHINRLADTTDAVPEESEDNSEESSEKTAE